MYHLGIRVAETVAVLGSVAAIGYYCLATWSALKHLRSRQALASSFQPPVSILKPLKGTDPHMYEAFRGHCLQDYPEYEIIFGVSEADDPAIALVERLKSEFPSRQMRLMVCPQILGTNVKVSNLAQMMREARYEHLVVNDSDIRVEHDYLRRVMPPLADERVGLVTALYRGVAAPTLGSYLEALGISTDFSAGVLCAQQVEGGVRFGLGSTLAFRSRELQKIGGFEALLDYLADDYELGARIADLGLKIQLAGLVVDTYLPAYSFADFLSHQMRWARTVRDSRPWGYFGLVLTFGTTWSLLALALAKGATWAWALLLITWLTRLIMARVVGRRVIGDDRVKLFSLTIVLRDILFAAVWVASYFGHKIHWRGAEFYLRSGKLVRAR